MAGAVVRLLAALVLLTGCAATTTVTDSPAPSAAPGVKRLGPAVVSRHASVKARRRTLPRTSRSLHRRPEPVSSAQFLDVTMYCETGSLNAAGQWPTVGTAAANAYPLGSRLSVEGYGVVTVEDRSAPGATGVDLYGGTDSGCEARAIAWGRRLLHVTEIR